MRVPAILALLCWVACASAWECDSNAEHLTAVDIKIKSQEDHVIYGQLHACPRAGEELSSNLRFRFQNPRNIILDEETGSFQYSPDREHFSGVDNFVYTVEDEVERSEPASVFISLRPQPDEPRLQVQHVQGNEGEVIPLHIQAQLQDQDGSETLTVTLCNCGQEVSCKSNKCKCQLSVPSGWHFLAGGQRVPRRNLNKLTQEQANQLSIHVPENSHGQYCFGVHAISVEQKGKGHVNAQISQDMHITVHSRNQAPTITHHSKTETLRWCTISSQEQQKCQEMSRAFSRRLNHRLECVQGQSTEDCMYKISHNMADVITLDGGDIYTAGSKYNLVPVMGEDYGNGDASYWAVAVVRKDNQEININNLRGHKSCHTGIGKTSGWNVPVGWLIQNNQMQVAKRQSVAQAVGKFFSKSCVPGAQSLEYDPDSTNPESLCSLCVGEGENRCVRNTNEPYYGYSGAFRCLVEGAGDVAFVNHVTVYENTNGHSEEEWARNLDEDDFELLCPDGSRRPWNQYKECNLARVPAHAVMTSYHSRKNLQQIMEVLNQAQEHFGFEGTGDFRMFDSSKFEGRDLMFRDNVQRLVPVGQRNTWQKWLGSSYMESVGHLISQDQERNQRVLNKQIRWCATSEAELEKCEQLSKTLTERGFVPTIKCVQADNAEQCMQMIHMNQADVITLDGGDIYQAGMKYNMRPIMGEDYGNGDASYWAVAVVRKDNQEIDINNLRGRKSCHTGIGKTSGWIIPTGWLVDQDFVHTDGQTSLVQAVGDFFSQSCVPGAKSPEYDPQNTNPSNLCSLCAGAGEDHCVRNKNEPYYGYAGAFRCLVEGAGDVAFINHQTVQDNTDGHNPENWAAGLRSSEFELLCPDGSRRPVDQWRECSLARVPSHAVMTSEERNQEWIDRAVQLLKNTQDMFGSDDNDRGFNLFDSSSFGGHDLLFRDDTHHLVEVGSKDSWEEWLGQEYLRCLRSHHTAEEVQPHSTLRWCTISSQEQQKCQEMSRAFSRRLNHRLECVQGQSTEDCMYKISHHQADVISLDGGDIYTAGSEYNLVPVMGEDYGNGDASYWAVAVVRKDNQEINMNNLRGHKSCHTGISKTSGWNVPVGWLIQNKQMQVDNKKSIPQAVGMFFSKSCVPGAQSPDYNPDGTNPKSLCSLCVGEGENRCVRNTNEPYYGYSGAFRCLVEGAGDVAFVNHVTVYENTNGHSEEEWTRNLDEDDFELLCPDGSRRPWNQYKECNLARVPSHAIMTSPRSRTDIQQIVDFLQLAQDHFGFQSYGDFEMFDSSKFEGRDLMFRDNVQRLVPVGQRNTWQKWLGSSYMESVGHLISHDQQRNQHVLDKQVRWCVTSDAEREKCEQLSRVQKEGVSFPTVQCVQADNADQCMQMIHMNQADVITLDGGDIYQAGMKYNMRPIMGEDYGNGDASYWAVAVVHKDNQEIDMNNLRGRKSCHTGIGKTSGWIIPTGWLVDQDFVHTDGQTSLVQAVGDFFSQSCVPGAKSPEYDPQNTNPSNLCSLCAGAGEDHCVRNRNEPYYGYAGAFRCLVEGAGDVAFINHQTVQDNTDGHNPENWAAGLRSSEFELLCPDGSRRPVDQWRECSLARVPSHAVMTSNNKDQEWVDRVVQWLKNTQEQFGSDENDRGFQMFDSSSFGGHDLLFRDDTHHLVEVGSKNSWEEWLGQEYLRCLHSHHAAEPVQPHSTLRWCTISSQEQQKCQEMSRAFSRRLNHRLECVQGQSTEDCMYKIAHHQADVITLDGGDVLTAGSKYDLVPVMGEDYGNGDASYWAVAVARINNPEINMNNLRGRKSCHTGISKTSGWNVPVGWLIQNNQMQVDNKKSIPQAVGKFFSKSCVPGAQSPEYNADGTNPKSLCSLCVGEGQNRCVRNTNEPYYGYSGAFRCLVEGAGDVAFVNHNTIFENTNGRSEEQWTRNLNENDYELLCPDGSRKQWHQYKDCNLARVPSHAVMTSPRSRSELQQIVNILMQAQEHFGKHSDFQMFDSSKFEGRDLMFRDNVQRLVPVGQRNTWQKWLGSSYLTSIRSMIHRNEERTQRVLDNQVRWCVTADAEREKCEQLSRTMESHDVTFPTIKCVQADNAEQCMQKIHMNQADVITLDGGDIYQAGSRFDMRPIMGEDYGNGDASYWAVAVVRKDNQEIDMNNLRGRKSCHTGIGKTSGWIIPTGWLVDQDFVHTDGQTSLVQAVGDFFSQSCVPGAKSPEYDPQNTNPSNLCSLCAGAGDDHCVRNRNEPYYGYAGAFRCLVEGAGDVAFINHQTVQDNTDGHNPENWAAGLRSSEFELLCPDGSRRPVDQWRECSLARVPSHAVMTSNNRDQEWVDRVVQWLKNTQEQFGSDENDRGFQMFDSSSFGGHDLLFRDDTHHLVEVGSKNSWEEWLGQEYLRCLHSHHAAEPVQPHSTLRWCTISSQEQQKCQEMSRAFSRRLNHRLECVQGQSTEDCMYKIAHHQADVITLDGGDVLTAGSKYDLVPVMGEDYGNGDASYWAVAVARINNPEINMNNLRGHKSCHTGISKTSGWNVPVGWLIQNNQMQVDSKKSIPQAVGKFFSKSCVPGAQSPEYNTDGTNPKSLCSLCVGEGENHCVRNTNEPYYGYSGAFRCLVEGAGDVAFVNHNTIFENTNGRSEEQWTRNLNENDYELLCPDGSRKQWHQYKDCNLARVPSHAVMTSPRSRSELQQIVNILMQAQEHFGQHSDFQMFDSSKFGGRDLMFRDNVQRLVPVGQRNTWQKWLGSSYLTSIRSMIHRNEERTQRVLDNQVRWCVTSDAEREKCEQLSRTMESHDVTFPTIKCVQADNAEQCMQKIHMNQADVITLDGGDIYQAGSRFDMRPIMGEDYGNGDASYWAVAVVRKDNQEIDINNLRGRKSCHTGIGKTSGWIIPTGWLVDQDFVHTDGQTSLVQAVGDFFSQSCVPGAKSPEYDPQNTNPSNLCSLCAGAGEDHCVRNKHEPYYGYAGAFRCLVEGAGDVAFINHQTVQDNTDGHNPENWAAGLRSSEFELLCPDGSRRPVDQWRECSLARVPSHAVMTSEDKSQQWVDRVVRMLKEAQDMFGSDDNDRGFNLFDSSSFGGHDLLFRDDTHHLVEVGSKDSWKEWLGQEYLRCLRSHHTGEHHDMHSMRTSGQQRALSTSEGRPVLLSNLRIQDAEGHNGRYHVHASVNQGGHLWIRDGLDGIVFTSDAKSTNQHHSRHHRHQDPHQHSVESELSREDSSSQEHSRRHSHESRSHESQSHESQSHESQSHGSRSHERHHHQRNHQDSNPISHLWDSLWQMWDENSSEERQRSSEEGQRSSEERQHSSEERWQSSEEGQHRHSSEERHQDKAWHDVHTSTETKRQELTADDDFYQHYRHHHFQYSNNGRPTLSFSGDLASVQKAVSSMVFVPWCEQWPTPPNWDLPPTTWMFPSEQDQALSEDPNHPAIWPAWYPRFWYPFPTKSWTWWPRVLPPYWLNKQCQDWTSMIHISVSEEAPSSCASQQDRHDRPVTDMDIPVHVQSRTNTPISLIPKNLFYYFDSDAESVPINDIHIRSQLSDVNLHLNFKVMEDHLATVQAESVENPEFTCTSVEECNEHLRSVKVHFRNGVRATDICHLGIQISMYKDNSDVPSDLLTVWAYQTSGRCVDPWVTNGNFHLSKERSQTNQGQTVNINLISEDLWNEESLNGILHVTIRAAHGLVTYTAPDGLRTFMDHMGVRQRIPTNLCVSGPAEMVKQALQTIKYTPIRAFTGTDNITVEYGTTRTAMRLSPDKIHPRMTVVHKVEVQPVSSPILVQAPSHMCVQQQQRPLPHIDTNLELQSLWHQPAPNMVKLTVTATSGDVNINKHKLQEQFHPRQSSQEHHRDMVHLDLDVQHRQRASGSWLQVVAEDWVVRHILHNQLVWYKPNKCVSSEQPIRHDTIHVEVEEVSSEHVTPNEIQVTVNCHQNQQQRWSIDSVSSEEQSHESHESHGVSSEWSMELSPWSVEQSSTQVEVTSDTECVPSEPWKEWSECDANSCQTGSQWRERRTRNVNPASNRYCQPQREQRQCTNCGCKPERQFVKHPSPSFQDCQTVRQVPRCPETCKPTKTSFVEEQFDCRGRTLDKDVLIHEACACLECAAKHTKESWHSTERQPSSNERWSEELGFPWN